MTTYVVLVGNLSTGFAAYGPFVKHENALKWAQENTEDTEFHISSVFKPKEKEQ